MNDLTPDWAPLVTFIPAADLSAWMWMGRVEHTGITIEQYKHRHTRRYLNLDANGNAWEANWPSDGCDPWCDITHEHAKDSPAVWGKISRQAALDWVLS